MASAKTSIGKATSSIRQVVPMGRVPPTVGKMPERMVQYALYSFSSVVNRTGYRVLNLATISLTFAVFSASSCSFSASILISNPEPFSGSDFRGRAGLSSSTDLNALRSKNSNAATGDCCNATTSSLAVRLFSKKSMALALCCKSLAVRISTSAKKARVPSEPAMRCVMISNGSSNSMKGRIFRPVTFLIAYFLRMRSERVLSACTRFRNSIMRSMNSG